MWLEAMFIPSPFLLLLFLLPQVYLGCHKPTGQYYAIKILEKKKIHPKGAKQIMVERNVLIQNLQHPFLVGLHYSFQTSSKCTSC